MQKLSLRALCECNPPGDKEAWNLFVERILLNHVFRSLVRGSGRICLWISWIFSTMTKCSMILRSHTTHSHASLFCFRISGIFLTVSKGSMVLRTHTTHLQRNLQRISKFFPMVSPKHKHTAHSLTSQIHASL